jgi:hypothetical protein
MPYVSLQYLSDSVLIHCHSTVGVWILEIEVHGCFDLIATSLAIFSNREIFHSVIISLDHSSQATSLVICCQHEEDYDKLKQ